MDYKAALRLLIFLPVFFPLVAGSSIWPDSWVAFIWGRTVVVGDRWLFIDGGNGLSVNKSLPGGQMVQWGNVTRVVDISKSWDNSSIPTLEIPKPKEYVGVYQQSMWYSQKKKKIYAVGGFQGTPVQVEHGSGPKSPWQLNFGYTLSSGRAYIRSARWARAPSIGFDLTLNVFGTLDVATPSAFYRLGGEHWVGPGTGSFRNGMLVFDEKSRVWDHVVPAGSNLTNRLDGGGVFLPAYGRKGVLAFLGGQSVTGEDAEIATNWRMDEILLYDIASRTFYTQKATGDSIPPPLSFCIVGVQDTASNGFDIFVYGGDNGGSPTSPISDVYVLSIPSFQWTKIQGSTTTNRAYHACSVIGKRQMVVVGGQSDHQVRNFISVFDLAALRWSSSYNANAAPYVRAPVLASLASEKPHPSKWDDPHLREIFQGKNDDLTPAVIVGIVGSVFVFLIFVPALVFYFIRRRRQWEQDKDDSSLPELESNETPRDIKMSEADGTPMSEAPCIEKPIEKPPNVFFLRYSTTGLNEKFRFVEVSPLEDPAEPVEPSEPSEPAELPG